MKVLGIISLFVLSMNVFAGDAHIYLFGKVMSQSSAQIIAKENKLEIETKSNSEFAAERQKFFVTDGGYKKVDLNAQLFDRGKGKISYSIYMKYIQDLKKDSRPVVFNVMAN